jgi:hypothetical protein
MSLTPSSAPRLYCLVAQRASTAIVFRRGPAKWFHLLRWDLLSGALEPGAWVRKKLYPDRCDLSPDGTLLLFYLGGGFGRYFEVFGGVSSAPWLHPHTSWGEHGTWGRGSRFVDEDEGSGADEPRTLQLGRKHVVIRAKHNTAFDNELRRGWAYAPECPPRDPEDTWDERRLIILEKTSGLNQLKLAGRSQCFAGSRPGPTFTLLTSTGTETLTDACWADWDHAGRLLIATVDGRLRMEQPGPAPRAVVIEHDLNGLVPLPQPAPEWARQPPT